ncbi:hypothetical protein [Enterobacter asburiae]
MTINVKGNRDQQIGGENQKAKVTQQRSSRSRYARLALWPVCDNR